MPINKPHSIVTSLSMLICLISTIFAAPSLTGLLSSLFNLPYVITGNTISTSIFWIRYLLNPFLVWLPCFETLSIWNIPRHHFHCPSISRWSHALFYFCSNNPNQWFILSLNPWKPKHHLWLQNLLLLLTCPIYSLFTSWHLSSKQYSSYSVDIATITVMRPSCAFSWQSWLPP